MRVTFGKRRDSYIGLRTLGLKYLTQQVSVLHLAHMSLYRVSHIHPIKSNCKFCHSIFELGTSYS